MVVPVQLEKTVGSHSPVLYYCLYSSMIRMILAANARHDIHCQLKLLAYLWNNTLL